METATRFLAHPISVGEGYFEHLAAAVRFGSRLLLAGGVCWIHALLPFLFTETASRMVSGLHAELARRSGADHG
jgi:hypothetical protein